MSATIKNHTLVEESPTTSSDKKENKEKDKNLPLIRLSNTDKNDIIIDLTKKKKYEDEDDKSNNSAEFSGQQLDKQKRLEETNNEKSKRKPIVLSKKAYDKYTERLKERTMRLEIEKIDKETQRLKKIFEEKHSHLHLFNNNPQFQKMLKLVQNQLIFIFSLGLLTSISSGLIYFYITRRKLGIALASFCLSLAEITMFILLMISLKMGLLNSPDLSKSFRLFVIIEFLLLISSFVLNIIIAIFLSEHLEKLSSLIVTIITYAILIIMALLFIISFKYCYSLFMESFLILFNKKTEYAILIINESFHPESNIEANLSSSNNVTTDNLNSTTSGIISENEKTNNNVHMNKDEEQYRNFNYFNKFHYSVTSSRKDDKYNLKKLQKK